MLVTFSAKSDSTPALPRKQGREHFCGILTFPQQPHG